MLKMAFCSKMKFCLVKMSVLFRKENIRKYTGNFQKILKRVFLITHAFYHEHASVIRKTPFNYTYRSQKTKDFVVY